MNADETHSNIISAMAKGHAYDQLERAQQLAAKDQEIAKLTAQCTALKESADGFEKSSAAAELRVVELEKQIEQLEEAVKHEQR